MIIITGGAGFIGSSLLHHLNDLGESQILIVDNLKTPYKWKNLRSAQYVDYMDKEVFVELLSADLLGEKPSVIYHMGACSNTSEANEHYLMHNNSLYTREIAMYCIENDVRLVYASSAATYGDGSQGYLDKHEDLNKLKPLNMYGYSKHLFDQWAMQNNWLDKIAGCKFFNVFGPREDHKGNMRSLPSKVYDHVEEGQGIKLFKSYKKGVADGEQTRDFIYIEDAVKIMHYLGQNPKVNGLFNVGRGEAVSWKQLAKALLLACKQEEKISYVAMPETLKNQYQYQYHTCADMSKLKKAGYDKAFLSIEESMGKFVTSQRNSR